MPNPEDIEAGAVVAHPEDPSGAPSTVGSDGLGGTSAAGAAGQEDNPAEEDTPAEYVCLSCSRTAYTPPLLQLVWPFCMEDAHGALSRCGNVSSLWALERGQVQRRLPRRPFM